MLTNSVIQTNKKNQSAVVWILSVLVVLTLQVGVTMGQVWNSATDWHYTTPQDSSDPMNDWLYGFKMKADGPTSAMASLFSDVDAGGSYPWYYYWADWDGVEPTSNAYIQQNGSVNVVEEWDLHWDPGQSTMDPGNNGGTMPVYRWVAPEDGVYNLDVTFTGNKMGGQYSFWMRTFVVANIGGTSTVLDQGYLYDGYYFSGAVPGSYVQYSDLRMLLSAGDSIDFLVDDGDSGTGSLVGLDATITQLPALTWNLSTDWHCDPASNPENDWAYGYKDKADGPTDDLVLYDWATCGAEPNPTYSYWTFDAADPWGSAGYVTKNTDDTNQFNPSWGHWEPSQVAFSPTATANAAFRWTAPLDGNFSVSVTFTGNSPAPTTTNVYVVQNNSTVLFSDDINGFYYAGENYAPTPDPNSNYKTFDTSLMLTSGDTIDFVVDDGDDVADVDLTGIEVTITKIPTWKTWSTSTDWHCADPASNPDNDWAYGYKQSATGSFTLFDWATCTSYGIGPAEDPDAFANYSYWTTADPWAQGGYIGKNNGDTDYLFTWNVVLDAQETTASPGLTATQNATFRWIAPMAGMYLVQAEFSGIDYGTAAGTTTDVHVVHNNSSILDDEVLGFRGKTGVSSAYGDSPVVSYADALSCQQNDTIDFVVGYGQFGGFNDSTGVDATIQEMPQPLVWFRADVGVVSDALGVTSWQDQSGNGNDALKQFGTPEVSTADFPDGQQHAVVVFDAAEGGDGFWLTDHTALQTGSATIYIVASVDSDSQDQVIFASASDAGSGYSLGTSSVSPNKLNFSTSVGGDLDSKLALTADRPYLIMNTLDASLTEKQTYVNGGIEASGTGSASYTNTKASIGVLDSGSKYLTGKIAEILVYDSVDEEQKTIIESYLNAKYGFETRYCGDADTVFYAGDVNSDCYVNLDDLVIMCQSWLSCTDPTDSNCN